MNRTPRKTYRFELTNTDDIWKGQAYPVSVWMRDCQDDAQARHIAHESEKLNPGTVCGFCLQADYLAQIRQFELKKQQTQIDAAAVREQEQQLTQATVPRHPKDRLSDNGTITLLTNLGRRTLPISEWLTFLPPNPTQQQLAAARGNAILKRKATHP